LAEGVSHLYEDLYDQILLLEKSEKLKQEEHLKNFQQTQKINKVQEEQIEPLELDYMSHKLLMLYYLGVTDFLIEKHPTLKNEMNTKLAKLLHPFIGKGENKRAETDTIRKVIEGLYSVSSSYNPLTEKAIDKVRSELSKVGIEIKS